METPESIPGPFTTEWDSLKQFRTPSWYEDGKFGIFIHWGAYCVPAFGSEWYPRNMYRVDSKEYRHHLETYGPHDRFGYKDFIPMFQAERFDPDRWAELFQAAGARFVVPVAEHHDGFPMYHTDLSDWCASKLGPKRDVVGELAEALSRQGLVLGVSSHRAEHFWFFDGGRTFPSDVQDPANEGLYGPAQPGPVDSHDVTQNPPDEPFLQDWLARTCELIDRYQPQLVWFDWWIHQQAFEPYLRRFAAYYYNRGVEWGKPVAINFKYGAFPEGTAVFDIERGQLAGIHPHFWQNDTSVSKNSWGYIEDHDYRTVDSLVDDLVDIVSKNGALLLNIGPKADGTIPEAEQVILRGIGDWLKINGDAIYGTRPWKIYGEGPTVVEEGAFTDTRRSEFTGQDIRFTQKGDTLYAIALAWPGTALTIRSLANGDAAPTVLQARLLGREGTLTFVQDAEGLHLSLPDQRPCEHAFAFALTLSPA